MARQHLRIEGGGDPARGPAREMANDPTSPRDTDEFPDVPAENAADAASDSGGSDDESLNDRVAEKFGLDDDAGSDQSDTDGSEHGDGRARVAWVVNATRSAGASGLEALARASERLADRLRRE